MDQSSDIAVYLKDKKAEKTEQQQVKKMCGLYPALNITQKGITQTEQIMHCISLNRQAQRLKDYEIIIIIQLFRMTDKKDTLLSNSEVNTPDVEPKPAKEVKKEQPTTLDAIKTNLMQQYRNMAAITCVFF
eukprot:TRINITY_DN9998_c0_g1_i2.p4 TRINITY_DN9998_c0_g1~~TRINITY_DN9998_c0_g1_i2.p4  ORF type:complete len:131 (+),score=6.68 TRINITY_DN9998_c0_g1_i2:237-629(+)